MRRIIYVQIELKIENRRGDGLKTTRKAITVLKFITFNTEFYIGKRFTLIEGESVEGSEVKGERDRCIFAERAHIKKFAIFVLCSAFGLVPFWFVSFRLRFP